MDTESPLAPIVGVDTIALVFSVQSLRAEGFRNVPGRFRIGVRRGRARVEASLPRRAFGNNIRALPVGDLEAAAADLLDEACNEIQPMKDATLAHNVAVARLDLVRDFRDVADIGLVLRSLAGVPRNPTLQLSLYGTVGRPQTLTVGTKTTWRCSLYDKHQQTHGEAPKGQLRFEARLLADRLQTTWATRHGGKVLVLADAHPMKLEGLARGSFANAYFDCSITTPDDLLDLAEAQTDLGATTRYALATHLIREATGRPCGLPRGTRSRYNTLARATLASTTPAPTVHLDWTAGLLL